MSIFDDEILKPIIDGHSDKPNHIPIHLERANQVMSIRKAIYTMVGSNTGTGKTAFVDDIFVLKPYSYWKLYLKDLGFKFRVLYRSMERKRSLKLLKWSCWKLYQDYGFLVDAETLLGYKKRKVTESEWNAIVESRDWAEEMLDVVDIRDGRTSPYDYERWVTDFALKRGTLLISNNIGIYDARNPRTYLDYFANGKTKEYDGHLEPIVEARVGDTTYVLKKDERKYIPMYPDEIVEVVADHMGKFIRGTAKNLPNKKAIIDKGSEINADIRDVFGYSPVGISQFNRAIGDTQRIKFANGDLSPILEDFKESGNTTEDADLVLALFDPYRYKSYDSNGMYKQYHIRDKMTTSQGFNRFRLLSVLKNSYGFSDVDFGMKFLGEVMDFRTLPHPAREPAKLQQVYAEILAGK